MSMLVRGDLALLFQMNLTTRLLGMPMLIRPRARMPCATKWRLLAVLLFRILFTVPVGTELLQWLQVKTLSMIRSRQLEALLFLTIVTMRLLGME